MKIGLICPYNIYRGGGVQECVVALRQELISRGHEVLIITPLPREKPRDHEEEEIVFLGSGTEVKSFRTTAQVSASFRSSQLESKLEEHQFDILHFHEPWVPMISPQILAMSKSINVATFHATLPDTMVHKTIEKVIIPYAKSVIKYLDALTAVSEVPAEYVQSMTEHQVQIIPNGVDLSVYKPSAKKSSNKTIFYIGRLEKRKGVKYLLKAFQKVQTRLPDARLVIGGDGPDREKLEDYVQEHAISNVEFLGYVTQEDKVRLMQESRVFCSPALYGESFGIVLLEAMACGTPVVAGNNPGYTTVLKDQAETSLVDPRKKDEFSMLLFHLLTDDAAYAEWRAWALKEVKRYDYVKVIDAYEALYKKLLKES